MVGDNSYDTGYIERLRALADDRVVFTGGVYGDGYWALQKHAGIFVFACEIGGVHPALIEAMAAENAVLDLDTPENNETAGDAVIRYCKSAEDLAVKLQQLLDDAAAREQWAARGRPCQRLLSLGCSGGKIRAAVCADTGADNNPSGGRSSPISHLIPIAHAATFA